MDGLFISFEGAEGSGKSTQIARLANRLAALDREVIRVREPGGTATGELVRDILQHDAAGEPISDRAETLLFVASRAQLVARVIRPGLARGAVVLCDRFKDSTMAYQGYGRGMSLEHLEQLHAFALDGCLPDCTILLDIPLDIGFARLGARHVADGVGPDRMEREARSFHDRVRDGYCALAEQHPERIVTVDGNRDPDTVEADVWECLSGMVG